jgi:hypothetical protein
MNSLLKSPTREQNSEQKQKFFDESLLFSTPNIIIADPVQDRLDKLTNPRVWKSVPDAVDSDWIRKMLIVAGLLVLLIFLLANLLIYSGEEVPGADFEEIWLVGTIQTQGQILGTPCALL